MAWATQHPDEARGRGIRIDVIAIIGPDPATATLEHVRDLR